MTAPAKAAPMREDVTQADREAAVEILSAMWFHEHGNVTYGWMRDEESATLTGKRDTYWAVKACARARHRLAHTARPDAGDGTWGPITEWEMINRLRDEEADTVTVLCDNPEGPPNNAVECCGFWTGFADRRFEGATIREALTTAVAAKDEASKVGYPPMSRPDAGYEDVERVYRQGFRDARYFFDPSVDIRESTPEEEDHVTRFAAMREGVDRGMVEQVSVPQMTIEEAFDWMTQKFGDGEDTFFGSLRTLQHFGIIKPALSPEQPR